MYYLFNLFNSLKFFIRHQAHRMQTHTVWTMQIDKNRHNRTLANLKVEQQDCRRCLNNNVR